MKKMFVSDRFEEYYEENKENFKKGETVTDEKGDKLIHSAADKVSASIDKSINKTYILNIYRGEVVTSSAY